MHKDKVAGVTNHGMPNSNMLNIRIPRPYLRHSVLQSQGEAFLVGFELRPASFELRIAGIVLFMLNLDFYHDLEGADLDHTNDCQLSSMMRFVTAKTAISSV